MRHRPADASRVTMTLCSVAFTLAATVLAACSPQGNGVTGGASSSHIVNGKEVANDSLFPGGIASSVVFVKREYIDPVDHSDKISICTGTLIKPDVVLTAGHCAPRGTLATEITVALHNANIANDPVITTYVAHAIAVVQHPGYQPEENPNVTQSVHDLSLLLLNGSVPGSAKLADLPSEAAPLPKELLAIGYGQSDDRHSIDPDAKGVGVLRYASFSKNLGIPKLGDNAGLIQIDGSYSSVCHGDSGGPLFAMENGHFTNVLVGVSESVAPYYSGALGADFAAAKATAMKAAQLAKTEDEMANAGAAIDAFYKSYPNAHDCVGSTDFFVDVRSHLDWITSTSSYLESLVQEEKQGFQVQPVSEKN